MGYVWALDLIDPLLPQSAACPIDPLHRHKPPVEPWVRNGVVP